MNPAAETIVAAPCDIADTGSPVVLLVAFCPEPGAASDSASVTIPRDLQVSLVRA